MARDRKEVVFNSVNDLSVGLYIDAVKEYLLDCPPIENVHDAILAFNCILFIENGIKGTDWPEDQVNKIKENTKIVKKRIGVYLKDYPDSIIEGFDELSIPYKNTALQMAERFNCFKNWDKKQVSEILNISTVRMLLHNKNISNYFKQIVVAYFDDYPLVAAELILEDNIGDANKQDYYCFPISNEEKAKYLEAYIQSGKAGIGGLQNILSMQPSIKNFIDAKSLALARRKLDECLKLMSTQNLDARYCTNIRVEYIKMEVPCRQRFDSQTNTYILSFSLDEIEKNMDDKGIFRTMYMLFDFVGISTGVIPLSIKDKPESFVDVLFSSKYRNGYNIGLSQKTNKILTYKILNLFYDFLVYQGVSIEKVLGEGFSEIIRKYFGIKNFDFSIPALATESFDSKCKEVASKITELYKFLYICLREEEIDNYYINAIRDIHWENLQSLFSTKYLYATEEPEKKQKISILANLMFSYQRSFYCAKYENEEIESNFELFLCHDVGRNEIDEAYNNDVEYLIEQKCLVEKNSVLKPTLLSQILGELWETGCISLLNTALPHNDLYALEKLGWLNGSNDFLAKSEQDFLSYLYGNKFTDAIGIRNNVAHVSNHGLTEEEHKENYLWLLYIIIVLELKFLEELYLKKFIEEKRNNHT